MEICNSINHDEVCYDGRNCPACAIADERDKLQEDNDKLVAENKELKEK